LELKIIRMEAPKDAQLILGASHFIKSVEDIYEAITNSVPNAKFGIGFCESSGPCLVRGEGNDPELTEQAKKNAFAISSGHSFIIFLRDAYPINVLNAIKMVPEVCTIHCATANPVEVVVAETEQGRGILGVVDGLRSKGIETQNDVDERKRFLRKIGYKLS